MQPHYKGRCVNGPLKGQLLDLDHCRIRHGERITVAKPPKMAPIFSKMRGEETMQKVDFMTYQIGIHYLAPDVISMITLSFVKDGRAN